MHHDETAESGGEFPTSPQGREDGDLWRLRERVVSRDLAVLGAVPAVLFGVYALPDGVKWMLALDHAAPTLLAAFASHYVHLSLEHLLGNLVGYVLVVSTGYVLSIACGRRRGFFVVFSTFLLAFPFLLSGLNLLFPRSTLGIGFSGILSAFVGYLPFALLGFLGKRVGVPIDARRSAWLFFFGLGGVAYLAAPGVYGAALAAAAMLAGTLFLLPVLESVERRHLASFRTTVAVSGYAELTLLGGLLFLAYPLVAFPETPTVGGDGINVYTHALGFCLGYIGTYVTALLGWLEID